MTIKTFEELFDELKKLDIEPSLKNGDIVFAFNNRYISFSYGYYRLELFLDNNCPEDSCSTITDICTSKDPQKIYNVIKALNECEE